MVQIMHTIYMSHNHHMTDYIHTWSNMICLALQCIEEIFR